MFEKLGEQELFLDYQVFFIQHFDQIRSGNTVKKFENASIYSVEKEDVVFNVAKQRDFIENIFSNSM